MFKHLLVPTDGSEFSTGTVNKAITFAGEIGARITFFFSKPDYPVALYGEGALIDPTTPEKFGEMADQQAEEILGKCKELAQAAGVSCGASSSVNNVPWEAIVEAAETSGCDLIFMASHGRRGIASFLLGSETQRVLIHTKIPVLVYR
ncbi:MAG: universal stress protein [Proteobacteria bacterium]|nr:universal stress protein [Pseudomonadota bacterium]HQR03462.1 universal stress protein [Rhodocyclaceae bacterium]